MHFLRNIIICLLISMGLYITSYGQNLKAYQCLEVDGNFKLSWQLGSSQLRLLKSADSNKIDISQQGNCLKITDKRKNSLWSSDDKIVLALSSKSLTRVYLNGKIQYFFSPIETKAFSFVDHGNAKGTFSSINADSVNFKLSGKDHVNISGLFAAKLEVNTFGQCDFFASGKVGEIAIKTLGKTYFNLNELFVDKLQIDNLGMINLLLNSTKVLDIDNTGRMSIKYYKLGQVHKENRGRLEIARFS